MKIIKNKVLLSLFMVCFLTTSIGYSMDNKLYNKENHLTNKDKTEYKNHFNCLLDFASSFDEKKSDIFETYIEKLREKNHKVELSENDGESAFNIDGEMTKNNRKTFNNLMNSFLGTNFSESSLCQNVQQISKCADTSEIKNNPQEREKYQRAIVVLNRYHRVKRAYKNDKTNIANKKYKESND